MPARLLRGSIAEFLGLGLGVVGFRADHFGLPTLEMARGLSPSPEAADCQYAFLTLTETK